MTILSQPCEVITTSPDIRETLPSAFSLQAQASEIASKKTRFWAACNFNSENEFAQSHKPMAILGMLYQHLSWGMNYPFEMKTDQYYFLQKDRGQIRLGLRKLLSSGNAYFGQFIYIDTPPLLAWAFKLNNPFFENPVLGFGFEGQVEQFRYQSLVGMNLAGKVLPCLQISYPIYKQVRGYFSHYNLGFLAFFSCPIGAYCNLHLGLIKNQTTAFNNIGWMLRFKVSSQKTRENVSSKVFFLQSEPLTEMTL